MEFSVDIELTNRCNAKCNFCPRDQTPHQGLMTPEVFAKSLERAIEYRDLAATSLDGITHVSLCGLGEPLLNKHAAEFTRQVRDAGFEVSLSSNGALLTEERGEALLEAGLNRIFINVADKGEDYERVYRLPFAKTRDNIVRFNEMAQGRCEVLIVLVDYRRDPEHIKKMRWYWKRKGIHDFLYFDIINRGGALFVDHMQYEMYPELARARAMVEPRAGVPLCAAPLSYLFIGYDGQYYLCCSDWKKETPMGSVLDLSFRDVTGRKLEYMVSREPVCKTCNLDPLNRLTEELRAVEEGHSDLAAAEALADAFVAGNGSIHHLIEALGEQVPVAATPSTRRLIPVQAL